MDSEPTTFTSFIYIYKTLTYQHTHTHTHTRIALIAELSIFLEREQEELTTPVGE